MTTKQQRADRYAAMSCTDRFNAARTMASLVRTHYGVADDWAATLVASALLNTGTNPTPTNVARIVRAYAAK